MKKELFYISTVSENAKELSIKYGLGLEIAEYATAYNMDTYFNETDKVVKEELKSASRFTFHMPFNELCPAAIDPLIKEIAYKRYRQAFNLAKSYGIKKVIIHSGYIPLVYHKSYFIEQSIEFFKNLLKEVDDDYTICLENVMEDEPYMLIEIVEKVDDKRFGLCIDLGHLNCQSKNISLKEWIEYSKDYIYHFHIHNNDKNMDTHNSIDKGSINYIEFFNIYNKLKLNSTITIESIDALSSIKYLIKNSIIEE